MSPKPAPSARGGKAPQIRGYGSSTLAALLLLAAAAAGLSWGAYRLSSRGQAPSGSWRGYATLLAEDSLPEAELLSALSAAGFRNVISASTEPVLVSNWIDLESLGLGEALSRLVKGDPRRDGYIESLASWFSAKAGAKTYRVIYIPRPSPQLAAKKLEKALGDFRGRIVLPDAEGGPSSGREGGKGSLPGLLLAFAILASASALGASRGSRRHRLSFSRRLAARLALAAPWIAAAYAGLPMAALASLWGLALVDAAASLDLPLAEYARTGSLASALDSLGRQAVPPLALLASAILAAILEPASLPSIGLAFLGSLACLAFFAVLARAGREGEGRALFVPKPIAAPGRSWAAASPWSAALACLAVGFWLLGLPGLRGASIQGGAAAGGSGIAFPRPLAVEGSARPGIEEARLRAAAGGKGRLPDLGSWLEHRALQEALPYGRVGSPRADPFGPVALSRPGGEAVPFRFDEEWARAAYKSIPSASVEGMLLAQGGPVAAFALPGPAGTGKGRPLAPIEVLRYIFLLIPPLGRIAAGLRARRGSGANETRQEA